MLSGVDNGGARAPTPRAEVFTLRQGTEAVETKTVLNIISDRPMSNQEWEQRYCIPREKQISEQ